MKSIYVGNLPFQTTEEDLEELFSAYGAVQSAKVISDRETGRSRGFGFVQMDDGDANEAISKLNGEDFQGRTLRINEAQERSPRKPQHNAW